MFKSFYYRNWSKNSTCGCVARVKQKVRGKVRERKLQSLNRYQILKIICIFKKWMRTIQESNRFVMSRHQSIIVFSSNFRIFFSLLVDTECSGKCKRSIRNLWRLSGALHSVWICCLVFINCAVCSILGASEQFHWNSIGCLQGRVMGGKLENNSYVNILQHKLSLFSHHSYAKHSDVRWRNVQKILEHGREPSKYWHVYRLLQTVESCTCTEIYGERPTTTLIIHRSSWYSCNEIRNWRLTNFQFPISHSEYTGDIPVEKELLIFVGIEHFMLLVAWIINKGIPDRAESVRTALARADYESRQALKKEVRIMATQIKSKLIFKFLFFSLFFLTIWKLTTWPSYDFTNSLTFSECNEHAHVAKIQKHGRSIEKLKIN